MTDNLTTEYMSNEEVIEVLKGIVFNGFDRTTRKERQALDLAIKALEERPQGEWINREAVSNTTFPFWERYECNQCHKFNGYSNFCPNCGASMKTNKTERNCEQCEHLKPKAPGVYGCELWECIKT